MAEAIIYKLLTRRDWEKANAEGVYRGSAHDERDGFIHFSTAAQLVETARKYFSGIDDLVLLAIDIEALEGVPSSPDQVGGRLCPSPAISPWRDCHVKLPYPQADRAGGEGTTLQARPPPSPVAEEGWGEGEVLLRWEPSRGGELFPHLYADLPLNAVREASSIPLDDDGIPIIPANLPS